MLRLAVIALTLTAATGLSAAAQSRRVPTTRLVEQPLERVFTHPDYASRVGLTPVPAAPPGRPPVTTATAPTKDLHGYPLKPAVPPPAPVNHAALVARAAPRPSIDGVTFYFGGDRPAGGRVVAQLATAPAPTAADGTRSSCETALIRALRQLAADARARGANAVVGILSDETLGSRPEETYICRNLTFPPQPGPGGTMGYATHVILTGTAVAL